MALEDLGARGIAHVTRGGENPKRGVVEVGRCILKPIDTRFESA
jgi:hypothetical protein